ncbi:pilus assembly protein TadG-related protein [Phyllobacterium phragmitis]|uniref:Pilus assembly protein n=1 Tax=Phyllobacterium phragmitis TaxID=2670329 RepID=A0ABQ0GWE1_9HYPH
MKTDDRRAAIAAEGAGNSSILARFRRDKGGNFAIMTSIIMAPLMLGGMAAIDAANLMRTRTNVQHALDAAALAVGRRFSTGASEAAMQEYGQKYFAANLKVMNPADVQFRIVLPTEGGTRQQLSAMADLTYTSLFGKLASSLTGGSDWSGFKYHMVSDVRVKNTVEVALVLDNSGSMDFKGTGSNKKRMDLLKSAAIQLVENMAGQATQVTRLDKPVQFSVVPFAGSVNVGPQYADDPTATWLDKGGRSSIHYENFDISQPILIDGTQNKQIKLINGLPTKDGKNWPVSERGAVVTRFSLFKELKVTTWGSQTKPYAEWLGCVEARPGRYNLDDTPPTAAIPDTLFVPMFAPDEYDPEYKETRYYWKPYNNWWHDDESWLRDPGAATRQRDLKKYFTPTSASSIVGVYDKGPNASCTTKPITPLTDVSTTAGLDIIKNAINSMSPLGATNVPEGMAWGWRTVSHGEPFTEGRPETERGNDKVVIVLTDGANTYYTRSYFNADDQAGSRSSYSAFGYAGQITPNYSKTRIFQNTSKVNTGLHTNENYTAAMNEQFATLCENVRNANIIVMTVALDLDATKGTAAERKQVQGQIDALTACSSESRSRRDENGRPARLFWNTTGGDLTETFRQIGDELSNLRIVG